MRSVIVVMVSGASHQLTTPNVSAWLSDLNRGAWARTDEGRQVNLQYVESYRWEGE